MRLWYVRSICVLAALLAFARPAAACSPIVSLAFLYAGPTIGAVALGAGLGLALVVAAKCVTFAVLCKDLRPARAAVLMFLANVVTTLLGVCIGLIPASGGGLILPLLPFVIWLAMRTARHLDRKGPVAAVLVALFVLSFFLWGLAEATWSMSSATFWGLKIAYTACALTFGFVMTAAWEAYLVHKWSMKTAADKGTSVGSGRLARVQAAQGDARPKPGKRMLYAAAWANVAAFGLVAVAGAAVALPLRLAHPDFLYLVAKRIAAVLA